MRAQQAVIGLDHRDDVVLLVDLVEHVALFVLQVERHVRRTLHADLLRLAAYGELLERADRGECRAFHRALAPHAVAMRAHLGGAFEQGAAAALAAHLHEAELADAAGLDAGAVRRQRVLHLALDCTVVLVLVHVDEVDDDEARQVTQAHLPRELFRGLEIGLQRRALDVALLGGAAGVDVHADQRLCRVNHEIAAGLELHGGVEAFLDLVLDIVAQEERNRVVIALHVLGVARHEHLDEAFGGLVGVLALHQHFGDILVVEIADAPLHEVAFLVDQRGRAALHGRVADVVPQARQVLVVARDFGLGALGAGRAHDDAHALRHVERVHDLLEALAVGAIGDLARNAATARRVGHEHAVAACQRQIGRHGRALVAALFLDGLDQQDLAALDHFLDLVAAAIDALAARAGDLDLLVRDFGVVLIGRVVLVGVEVLVGLVVLDVIVGVLVLLVLCHRLELFLLLLLQGEFVLIGELVVVGVDLGKGEEAVAVAAIFDEGGLERRLYARDLGEIDIATKLALVAGFEVEFFDVTSVDDDDPGFFRVGRIDQHTFCHGSLL